MQIDLEASFIQSDDIFVLIEGLLRRSSRQLAGWRFRRRFRGSPIWGSDSSLRER